LEIGVDQGCDVINGGTLDVLIILKRNSHRRAIGSVDLIGGIEGNHGGGLGVVADQHRTGAVGAGVQSGLVPASLVEGHARHPRIGAQTLVQGHSAAGDNVVVGGGVGNVEASAGQNDRAGVSADGRNLITLPLNVRSSIVDFAG